MCLGDNFWIGRDLVEDIEQHIRTLKLHVETTTQ